MRCAICGESIGNAAKERWGPEFAHSTCAIAFNHGKEAGRDQCVFACEAEALTNAINCDADRAYNTAINHCVLAIRAL